MALNIKKNNKYIKTLTFKISVESQQMSRSQTTTSNQQFQSRRSNLNNQNTNLDITDINNRFLQLLNQLQMQGNSVNIYDKEVYKKYVDFMFVKHIEYRYKF